MEQKNHSKERQDRAHRTMQSLFVVCVCVCVCFGSAYAPYRFLFGCRVLWGKAAIQHFPLFNLLIGRRLEGERV